MALEQVPLPCMLGAATWVADMTEPDMTWATTGRGRATMGGGWARASAMDPCVLDHARWVTWLSGVLSSTARGGMARPLSCTMLRTAS